MYIAMYNYLGYPFIYHSESMAGITGSQWLLLDKQKDKNKHQQNKTNKTSAVDRPIR